jgi:glycosyltransferase involved in cell wall biosynthesis
MPPRIVAIYLRGRIHGSRERVFLELIRRLVDSGTRVDVLVAGAEGWLRGALDSRAHVEDLSRCWMGTGWFRLPHLLRVYLSVPLVAGYLRRVRPDVLFATSIPPNLASLAGRALARTSTVVVVRQSNVLRLADADRYAVVRRRPRDWLLPMLYRRADRVIAVSAGVADNLCALRAGHADRITIVPNGVALGEIDTKAAQPVDHPWLQTQGEPVLLAVGRLVVKKDYPTLLKAFAIIRRICPVRLIILGDGPERSRLEALARRLEVERYVSMPGFRANPFAYFARAGAYVLSSISEGMPSSLIEALACGCPVVSTDCPSGPSEILENGRYGRLVAVGRPEALAEALLWTLRQPRSDDRLRARARELSLEACVERYLEILTQASHRQHAARHPEVVLATDQHS